MLLLGFTLAVAACGEEPPKSVPPTVVPDGAEWVAVKTLTFIFVDEVMFQRDEWVDQDGDGAGQFASLGELLGVRTVRGTKKGRVPAVSQLLGLKPTGDGDFEDEHYRYRLFLPTGSTAGTNLDADPEGYVGVTEDLAESYWVCYAWPRDTAAKLHSFVTGPGGLPLGCDHDAVPWGAEGPSVFSAAIEAGWAGTRGLAGSERPPRWRAVQPP